MEHLRSKLVMENRLLRILEHFWLAKVDYAMNISRYTEIQRPVVLEYLNALEEDGLIEKFTNTSIKRTEAKLKKSAEVHKHHTYFQLTKLGINTLKSIDTSSYLELIGTECISRLKKKKERQFDDEKCERMKKMGLLDRHLELTNLGKEVLNSLPSKSK